MLRSTTNSRAGIRSYRYITLRGESRFFFLAQADEGGQHCSEWGLECSYRYQRKRRGRRNQVVERLAAEQKARKGRQKERSENEEEGVHEGGREQHGAGAEGFGFGMTDSVRHGRT
jgi:hypothetical protein